MAIFGEIGLSGEIRAVNLMDLRVKEAAKLGFKKVLMPKSIKKKNLPDLGIKIIEIGHLQDLINMFMK